METTMTIPKRRIVPSLAAAGLVTINCADPSHGMLTSLLEECYCSTGSNASWLETALPNFSQSQGADLYVLTIQRLKSLNTQDAAITRSDRDSLLEIKDVLSLTGVQLAKAMRVSRTSLYQWIDESKTMRPKSRDRLEKLRILSDQWLEKVGVPISRSPWVGGTNRTRLAEMLTVKTASDLKNAGELLVKLAAMKPEANRGHRSVLEIIKEKNLENLPEHLRQAERTSRLPSARITPELS